MRERGDFLRSAIGPIGVCAYIAGFAIPFKWDIPLLCLTVSSVTAIALARGNSSLSSPN
jgi:hypothetical protein